jgi:hypothetical protein
MTTADRLRNLAAAAAALVLAVALLLAGAPVWANILALLALGALLTAWLPWGGRPQ